MANYTGYKQAVIAYKVDKDSGEPLDVDGNRTAQSGKRQAIVVLRNFPNPDPAKYQIERYFEPGEIVVGTPTLMWDPDDCEQGARVPWVLDGGTWQMQNFWINNELWNF